MNITVDRSDANWTEFLSVLATCMKRFRQEKGFSMDDAFSSLQPFAEKIDSEIVEFAYNTISEIGGFPKGYSEVLELAENHVSAEEFKLYMGT